MAARKWTMEQRKTQSQAIRRWKSWESSTGPRSAQGKATSSKNAFKHGCDSKWVKRLRFLERDLRQSDSASLSAYRELEVYRREVEKQIAENALKRGDPNILVKAFGYISNEVTRSTRQIYRDLELFGERPGGLGAFLRKFEWKLAVLRGISSFQKKRKSDRLFRWVEVEIPGNRSATTKNPSPA